MKKISAAILLLVYFVATTGFVIHRHYCMGNMTAASLFTHHEKKMCDKCAPAKKKDCCSDQQRILKLEKQFENTTSFAQWNTFSALTIINYTVLVIIYEQVSSYALKQLPNKPPGSYRYLYITHCTYII